MWKIPSLAGTEMSNGSELAEGYLGPPPCLDLDLEHFLGGHQPWQGAEGERDPQQDLWPEPFLDYHCCYQCVDTPA